MPILGVPLWYWMTGGLVVGGAVLADQAGDAAEQIGDAAEKSSELAKWVAVIAFIFVSYRALQATGALK